MQITLYEVTNFNPWRSQHSLVWIVTRLWAGIAWSSHHSRSKIFLSFPQGPNRPWGPPKRLLNAYDL